MEDLLARHRGLIGEERWIANQHLKEDGSARPPVHCFIVAILSEDLGRDVIWGTHSRKCQLSATLVLNALVLEELIGRVLRDTGEILSEVLIDIIRPGLDLNVLA